MFYKSFKIESVSPLVFLINFIFDLKIDFVFLKNQNSLYFTFLDQNKLYFVSQIIKSNFNLF